MKNIVLIGMPGSGKSTIGVLAAKALGMGFLDTDILLQNSMGMLLHEYIEKHGIDSFLAYEGRQVSGIGPCGCVIATGGSVVMNPEGISALAATAACVVYLRLPLQEIVRRLVDIKTRGIAMDKHQTIEDVYALRAPLYERYSTLTVDSAGYSVERTVAEVVRRVRKVGAELRP